MREDFGTQGLGDWLARAGMGFGELVAFCPNYFDDALELFRKIARKPTDEIGQEDDAAIADVERMLSETVASMHSDELEQRFRAGFLEMNASLLGEKPRKIYSVAEAAELIIETCRFIRGVRPQATQLERGLLGARPALDDASLASAIAVVQNLADTLLSGTNDTELLFLLRNFTENGKAPGGRERDHDAEIKLLGWVWRSSSIRSRAELLGRDAGSLTAHVGIQPALELLGRQPPETYTYVFAAGLLEKSVRFIAERYRRSPGERASEYVEELDLPPDPFAVFDSAMEMVFLVRAQLGGDYKHQADADRMLLVQMFSILEAFLRDRLLNVVSHLGEPGERARRRLCTRMDSFNEQKWTLRDVAKASNILLEQVVERIKEESFHDFKKVAKYYDHAISLEMLPTAPDDVSFLNAAVAKRHDCVHRNGKTKEGVLNSDINEAYLQRLASLFKQMARNVDAGVRSALAAS
ncbi:hypothetical protein [Rhizobium sp. M1]|uniref:hypothetical protein n=1 Tax=Rhizobium sp. M1 TaxID=2035453 RepID=UPI000BE9F394|nr:hypothetical protein [Rhizobium sp. M1]PDT10650.1 hypothetical protein CO655_12750 [Rhizobium sp. M1]